MVEHHQHKRKAIAVDKLIGKRLRQQRIALGLRQSDLAQYINVSTPQIQKYEQAINRVSASTLYVLAQWLQVSVSYFFTNEQHK